MRSTTPIRAGRSKSTAQRTPENPDRVLIAVKDNGIGIPEEFRERIWNRFERYEEHALVMDVAGTGLGLSIVKTLVEMHDGDVWFESEETGTTFYVSLPIEGPKQVKLASDNAGSERVNSRSPQLLSQAERRSMDKR